MKKHHVAYSVLRWAFFATSLAYLGHFAYTSIDLDSQRNWFSTDSSARVLVAAGVFALTAAFSIVGWRVILLHLSQPQPFARTAYAFCITQIAKYLPGNVGHHVGRIAVAKSSLGIPASVTIISIMQESALACLAALIVGAMSLVVVSEGAYASFLDIAVHGSPINFGAALFGIVSAGILVLFAVNAWRKRPSPTDSHIVNWLFRFTPSWPAVLLALPSYLAIYLVNGLALWIVAASVMELKGADLLILTGAYSLSWMVGFLLPGAPGGLGVREAALAMILNGIYPAEAVFSISVLSRVSTVVADLLIFAFGVILSRRSNRTP